MSDTEISAGAIVGEQSRYHRAGQALTYYRLDAPSPQSTLVMIHGLASNATRWTEFMTHTCLRQWMDLQAVDLRGHGRSMVWGPFSRQDWVADLAVQVERARQAPVVLMGHSLGAQVALAFAAAYPQRVAALVLIDPVFPRALHGVLGRVARYRSLVLVLARLLRVFYRLGLRRRRYPYRDLGALDRRTRAYLAEHPHAMIADLYMSPLADLKYIPYANYLQDLYEVTRPLPDLAPVSAPALVLLSAGASTADVTATRRLLGQLSDCSVESIDADHWLLTERPEQARQVIEHWLQDKREEGWFAKKALANASKDLP